MRVPPILIILSIATAFSGILIAATQSEGDSILDRLERRLLEKERNALSFGEGFNKSKDTNATEYKYRNKIIDEFSPSSEDIKKIDQAITELESQVEYLASGVHAVKQKILQDAGINNNVTISALLQDNENMAYRSLQVTIDGHLLYEQNAALGLWIPDSRIPLFQGPMQPGKHRLEFKATIAHRSDKSLPLEQGKYSQVSETYNFTVNGKDIKKSWEIRLESPDKAKGKTKAEFKVIK